MRADSSALFWYYSFMTLIEAKALAQQGIKVTHQYFTDDEWMIMRGNVIQFEDGAEIFFDEWVKGKPYLLEGWSRFNNQQTLEK